MRLKECKNCGEHKMANTVEYFTEPVDQQERGYWCEDCREDFESDGIDGPFAWFFVAYGLASMAVLTIAGEAAPIGAAILEAVPEPASVVLEVGFGLIQLVSFPGVFAFVLSIFLVPVLLYERKHHPVLAFGEQRRVERTHRNRIGQCLMCDTTDTEGVRTDFYREYVAFGVVVRTLEAGEHEDCLTCHEDPIDMALRSEESNPQREVDAVDA